MFHDLTLQDVRRETEDAVVLVFDASEPAFTWKPGQYLTLRAEVGGRDIRRSYSIASLPDEPLCVGVKRVEGGAFSSFAQALDVGAQIQVMPPEGRFVDPGYERLILIAAGSGITPMVSIAGAALARGAEVTLVYGNRRSDTIMFRETLETLKDRYLNKFTLIHILSREAQDVPLLHGHIDGDKLSRLAQAGAIDLAGADGVFLCGPSQMIDGVQETLLKLGVDQDHIHHERFFVEGAPVPTRPSLPAEGGVANGARLCLQGRPCPPREGWPMALSWTSSLTGCANSFGSKRAMPRFWMPPSDRGWSFPILAARGCAVLAAVVLQRAAPRWR